MRAIDAIMGKDAVPKKEEGRIVPTGGRVSVDVSGKLPFSLFVQDKSDGNRVNEYVELEIKNIKKLSPDKLYQILVDSDPEVGLALYHFLSFCNVGYDIQVFVPDSDVEHVEAKEVIKEFETSMEDIYGGFDVLLGKLFYSVFVGGAVFMEILLDNEGFDILDFIIVNPHEARFRKGEDEKRGMVWQLGQIDSDGEFVDLSEYDTVTYMPFHPAVGSPYGRPLVSPTIFSTLFLISILKDLERVIRHQGWKRLDIILNAETLKFPTDGKSSEQDVIDDAIDEIKQEVSLLEPDDIFVHTNHFEFGTPVGTTESFAFQGVTDLIQVLERRIIRAIKSQPLLMGSNEAVTETHANRQWEIYSGAIRSIQGLVSKSVSNLLRVALEARGIIASVNVLFEEFRDSERMRDLQADFQEFMNIQFQVQNGWITNDEAANIVREKMKGVLRTNIDGGGAVGTVEGSEGSGNNDDGNSNVSED